MIHSLQNDRIQIRLNTTSRFHTYIRCKELTDWVLVRDLFEPLWSVPLGEMDPPTESYVKDHVVYGIRKKNGSGTFFLVRLPEETIVSNTTTIAKIGDNPDYMMNIYFLDRNASGREILLCEPSNQVVVICKNLPRHLSAGASLINVERGVPAYMNEDTQTKPMSRPAPNSLLNR